MSFGAPHLAAIFGTVAFGAVVPVVPTGAAVSVGAVLSARHSVVLLVLVVVAGAAGAYLGDIVTYAVLRVAGDRLSNRVSWLRPDRRAAALERFQEQIRKHELRTLLVSRLVPAGRVPVLLAAAVGGYPWRRYVSADIGAALLWSVVYAAIGLLGRSVFPQEWEGVVAAVVIVLLISAGPPLWRRILERRGPVAAGDGRAEGAP